MAKADVEMLRRAYPAFNEHGLGAVAHLLDDEFEMRVPPDGPFAALGPFHGSEGWARLLAERDEAFAEVELRPERFIDLGERVLVLGSQTARSREGGVELETTMSHLWTLRDGKALICQIYVTHEAARTAVGLEE